jgi:hypothetical protein
LLSCLFLAVAKCLTLAVGPQDASLVFDFAHQAKTQWLAHATVAQIQAVQAVWLG